MSEQREGEGWPMFSPAGPVETVLRAVYQPKQPRRGLCDILLGVFHGQGRKVAR